MILKKNKDKANKLAYKKWMESKALLELKKQQRVERIHKKWEQI